MKNWYTMAALVMAAVLVLTLCLNALPFLGDTSSTTESTEKDEPGTSGNMATVSESDDALLSTHPAYSFEPKPTYPDSEITYTCYQLPETVENPDDLPVLKWVCFLDEYDRNALQWDSLKWTEEAFHELNQMLEERNKPFRIQFVVYDYQALQMFDGNLREPEVDWFERPELQEALADADLVFGWMKPEHMSQYLMPLTEYVTGSAQPSLTAYFPHSRNQYATADGEIYGIHRGLEEPITDGWSVKPEFMEAMGLTAEDFAKPYWEMDELFAKIYEKNGNEPFLWLDDDGIGSAQLISMDTPPSVFPGAFRFWTEAYYQMIGACFGVDLTEDLPAVVNTLETETVRNIRAAVLRYRAAGYGVAHRNPDGPEVGNNPRWADVYYGAIIIGDQPYTDLLEGRVWIPVTPSRWGGPGVQVMNGVAKESQYKEEALDLLSLIMEDEEFRTRLLYGKEGRDYTVKGGVYKQTVQVDGSIYDMDFLWDPDQFSGIASQQSPVYEGMTPQESYQYRLEEIDQMLLPIVFDYSGYEEELEAMGAVMSKYFYDLTRLYDKDDDGTVETPVVSEELYDQMLQELKDAGSETVIAELQRQLDAWLAENPDWLAQYGK